MTGKTDMVPVLNLPSHLSQPSQSENVPIFDSGTRYYFAPENRDLGANPGKEKRNSQSRCASRPLPAVLPPVGRCVTLWGGGGVRIPPSLFGRVLGSFSVRRKRSRRKGRRRGRPHPGHFCPHCGQLRRSATGVVEGNFRRAVGSKTEMIPQLREKLRGRGKNSRRKAEMTNNKEKYAFWLTPEAKKMIEINAPLANCGSQSEFVEKAVRFYDGYLKVQNAGAFLPHAVADVLEGSLGVFENRMAKLLFNLAVEHNITNHLLAADVDITREEYNKLRGGSVREVTSTRGMISLRDVISDSQE